MCSVKIQDISGYFRFIVEHPIKMDDLGGPPLFLETPIYQLKVNEVRLHIDSTKGSERSLFKSRIPCFIHH